MENSFSPAAPDVAKKFDAQKFASDAKNFAGDAKNEARSVADRGKEAASDVAGRAKDLIDEVKSSGRELVDEYAQVIKRRKRQLSDVSTRVGEYADDNTALVAGGALVLGIALGIAFSKRSA
ncbi:MAG: hypothetical protein ACM369_04545 [Acidobacteriota bacterium]|jgi:hypothetical protein